MKSKSKKELNPLTGYFEKFVFQSNSSTDRFTVNWKDYVGITCIMFYGGQPLYFGTDEFSTALNNNSPMFSNITIDSGAPGVSSGYWLAQRLGSPSVPYYFDYPIWTNKMWFLTGYVVTVSIWVYFVTKGMTREFYQDK